jgi:hypothetical protein
MRSFNLHPLFNATIDECYEKRIALSTDAKTELMGARTAIRTHLRSQLPKRLAAARVEEGGERIEPRFIMQGSYAYGLINAPAHPPRQQADLDDGVYVPLSFCEDTGSPKAVSRLLIEVVEQLLTELASRTRGWSVKVDNPNCTRVIIAPDKHVDVPIYSIPDAEFRKIAQFRFSLEKRTQAFDEYYRGAGLDDVWEIMPERVRLAHKTLGWLDSDPRPIKDWIDRQALLKTEQLRRLIRYLKAWRDVQAWPHGDPKSILLMALVDATLKRKIDGRDDLALIEVCRAIPEHLRGAVTIAPIPNEDLSKALDKDGIRVTFVQRISALHGLLSGCVGGRHTREEACRLLRQEFGSRFPQRPDRIREETPEEVVHAKEPRRIAAAPIVGRRIAG